MLEILLLSVLAGQCCNAHITAIRAGGINPELLDINWILSENGGDVRGDRGGGLR